ncbi:MULTISPECIES: bifunctional 2-polyprenyl-6-hydroxyphenol methylase/3-demethylubiquinol 3-O-methyltransferase UbiG [unclassified Actinotalea]|uniref:class I SAM-dependent methyltransferase n=1 Tax=unclassified Actinotalea TaxID=2638618 RepID=UPI0015F7137E|nr:MULTISPECIES: class I SAM-dependent methyltransferase [unclassified Actinotalea]
MTTTPITALPAPSRDPFWNHNTHYHRRIPRAAPPPWGRVLDVGCGEGLLTRRLAGAATREVVGVDASPVVVDRARAQADSPLLRYVTGDAMTADLGGPFDLVTCVATLHHLPLRDGIARLRGLVAPGGALVVVGLSNPSAPLDWAVGALGMVATRWAHARRAGWNADVPLADATTTYGEVREAARELLPGAVVRLGLYWRYTLVWRSPA